MNINIISLVKKLSCRSGR